MEQLNVGSLSIALIVPITKKKAMSLATVLVSSIFKLVLEQLPNS